MENQFYILPCFYRYNSEKMPLISVEKQFEIIKKTSSGKNLTNITFPIMKNVLNDGVNLKNQREFSVLLNKKKSFLIKEGTYFLALAHIFLNSGEEFKKLDEKTVLEKYLTKSYIRDTLTKQLFILNDIWKNQDFVLRDGVDGYYTLIENEVSSVFLDKAQIKTFYDFFTLHKETLKRLEHCGTLGYFCSNYLRFLELGYNAGYLSSEEYTDTTNDIGHKVKWLFKSWDDYFLSVAFGGVMAQHFKIYNDFLPLNRLLYNIKAMVQYLPEIFENTNIWEDFNKDFLLDYLNKILKSLEITIMTRVEFLSFYDTYLSEVMNASYLQFQNIFLPLARSNNLVDYFITKNKNSFLILPQDPFTTEFDLEKLNFLNLFSPGEFPFIWDGECMITNLGIWGKKTMLTSSKVVFLESFKVKNIKVRLKNDLTFQLRVGRVPVLNLSPVPSQFNQTVEEFYLSKRSVIKRNLNEETSLFEKFFSELFSALTLDEI